MRSRQAYARAHDRINVAVCDFQSADDAGAPQEVRELLMSARTVVLDNSQPAVAARCDGVLGQYERAEVNLEATEKLTLQAISTFSSPGLASDAARAQYSLGELWITQRAAARPSRD